MGKKEEAFFEDDDNFKKNEEALIDASKIRKPKTGIFIFGTFGLLFSLLLSYAIGYFISGLNMKDEDVCAINGKISFTLILLIPVISAFFGAKLYKINIKQSDVKNALIFNVTFLILIFTIIFSILWLLVPIGCPFDMA